MSSHTFELGTRDDTRGLARRIAQELQGGDLVVLAGPLGAGKTFLARAICRALGLPHGQRVTSPTFVLAQEYDTSPPIVHADLYRLTSREQVLDLGLDERRAQGCVLLVEWGKPYLDVLGADGLVVELSPEPRQASLSGVGRRGQELVTALSAT